MDVASVEERTIPGPAGDIPVRIYRPEDPTGATVVFFHGGGWIIGDLDSHDGHARRLAATVGAVVVHVDYRLAPEHPFPAAHQDCVAAIEWAFEHVDELGGRADRIAVAGDSAGGNLAAAVALHCRDTRRRSSPSCSSTPPSTSPAAWPLPATTASSPGRTTGSSGSTSATTSAEPGTRGCPRCTPRATQASRRP